MSDHAPRSTPHRTASRLVALLVAFALAACLPLTRPETREASDLRPLPPPPPGLTRSIGSGAFATPPDWVIPTSGDLATAGLPTTKRIHRAAASPDGTCLATTTSHSGIEPAPADDLPESVTIHLEEPVEVVSVTPIDVPDHVETAHHVLTGNGQRIEVWGGFSPVFGTGTHLIVSCADQDLLDRIGDTWAPGRPR